MIQAVKYPIGTLVVVFTKDGVFYGHPEICIVADYEKPYEQFQLNGEIYHTEWLGLFPYNRDAFNDRKISTLGTPIEATKYYVSLEDSPSKYIKPYLFQYNEDLVEISTREIWVIDSIDFHSSTGRIGKVTRATHPNPKGFSFLLKPKNPELRPKTISRQELETKYTLT